jgi:hypothetical protein
MTAKPRKCDGAKLQSLPHSVVDGSQLPVPGSRSFPAGASIQHERVEP